MTKLNYLWVGLLGLQLASFQVGCGDDEDEPEPFVEPNEPEIITQTTLTLSPMAGGPDITLTILDIDNDGPVDPVQTPPAATATIAAGNYQLFLGLLNTLENPPEDIAAEVQDEAEEHQIFYTATGVTVAVTDTEATYMQNNEGDDLPVGLQADVDATTPGAATIEVNVRHLEEVDGMPVKVAGIDATAGEQDVRVTFEFMVE